MTARADRNGSIVDGQLSQLPTHSPSSMVRLGKRDGCDWRLRLRFPPLTAQTPYPTRDNPRLPAVVEECAAAANDRVAAFERDYDNRCARLEKRIAEEQATVASMAGWELPRREKTWSTWVYIPILAGLGFTEWVVNAGAFSVFGGRNYVTYIIALMVAVVMPLCAHVTGSSWKEKRHYKSAILAVTLAVSLIVAVALIRQAYFYSYVQSLLGLNIAPWLLAIIYVVINLTMFGGGTLASFRHAEADPEGQAARRRLEAAKRRLSVDRASLANLPAQYVTLCRQQTARLRVLAHAYNRGNMSSRRRASHPENREQPVWIDRVRNLEVAIPDALLGQRPAAVAPTAGAGTTASSAASERPGPALALAASAGRDAAPATPIGSADQGADRRTWRVGDAAGRVSTSTNGFGTVYVDGFDEAGVQR